jgi:ribosomal protein S18 acetylase RimI-like enzyme
VVRPPRPGVAVVAHLGVSPYERGRGIGRELILHLENVARERGFPRAGLDVAETNPRARALYERLGYTFGATHAGGLTRRYGRVVAHHYLEKGR